MAEVEILWTRTALRQRNSVLEYWNNRNKSSSYSRKLVRRIRERLSLLKENPESGVRTELADIRVLSLHHYSIVYKIDGSKVYVMAFWDNRQDPARLLELLRNR